MSRETPGRAAGWWVGASLFLLAASGRVVALLLDGVSMGVIS